MKDQLMKIEAEAKKCFAKVSNLKDIEALRLKYLGKKGALTNILKQMGNLSPSERPVIGKIANKVRESLEATIKIRTEQLKAFAMEARLQLEKIDVTLPGKKQMLGHKHPLSIVLDDLKEIFIGMGFKIAEGPEIESNYYAFDTLNIPKDHPARDEQDTFYINDDIILRSQTSSVQIRTMQSQKPPIKIIAPGRVYRSDTADATHSPIFHQVEGLVIDKGITFANLKYTLQTFVKKLYGEDSVVRFRPHHFPYTEPSAELDVQCFKCGGKCCPLCKGEGYIELLGCGMVHPNVLKICGIDPDVYSGFAFGVGLERLTMRRFKINDIRFFYENDVRFLNQF